VCPRRLALHLVGHEHLAPREAKPVSVGRAGQGKARQGKARQGICNRAAKQNPQKRGGAKEERREGGVAQTLINPSATTSNYSSDMHLKLLLVVRANRRRLRRVRAYCEYMYDEGLKVRLVEGDSRLLDVIPIMHRAHAPHTHTRTHARTHRPGFSLREGIVQHTHILCARVCV
jgi:hypothetical protein